MPTVNNIPTNLSDRDRASLKAQDPKTSADRLANIAATTLTESQSNDLKTDGPDRIQQILERLAAVEKSNAEKDKEIAKSKAEALAAKEREKKALSQLPYQNRKIGFGAKDERPEKNLFSVVERNGCQFVSILCEIPVSGKMQTSYRMWDQMTNKTVPITEKEAFAILAQPEEDRPGVYVTKNIGSLNINASLEDITLTLPNGKPLTAALGCFVSISLASDRDLTTMTAEEVQSRLDGVIAKKDSADPEIDDSASDAKEGDALGEGETKRQSSTPSENNLSTDELEMLTRPDPEKSSHKIK